MTSSQLSAHAFRPQSTVILACVLIITPADINAGLAVRYLTGFFLPSRMSFT